MSNKSKPQTPHKYIPIIGMEVHAELKTKSKMFCGCKNDPFHAPKPNMYTCPVCLGMPGGLPVANKTAIEWTIKLGLALNCKINLFSKFDRKNYFYPDLPKGYQISQYDLPFCFDGVLETSEGPVRIRRIHLEEDTGKLQHKTISSLPQGENSSATAPDKSGRKVSLIDYNRSSVPLIEIVTEPDIHSSKHAKAYTKKLRQILRFLDISDCDMEQGSMRLEANISLIKTSETLDLSNLTEDQLPNYKVEVKNINSFNFLAKAIDFEVVRHTQLLDHDETPIQETRGWNENKNETFSQRTKEDAQDYRYFPDPDLPPIVFTQKHIDAFKAELPELPDQILHRWETDFAVEPKYGQELLDKPETATLANALFIQAEKQKLDVNKLANMLVNKKLNISLQDSTDTILSAFIESTSVDTIDSTELERAIEQILEANPKAVEDYRSGKEQIIGFLIGQTMRTLGKKVDVQQVRQALMNYLSK